MSQDRCLRRRLCRPRHRACFAELGHDVAVRDIVPGEDRCAAPRRGADLRAGPRRAARAKRESACATRSTSREALDGADFVYVCVDTPPLYSGDADLSRVWTVVDELPLRHARDDRDEVDGAGGHGREGARSSRRARARERRLRLEPGVHGRGHRGARLHGARSHRRRRIRRGGRRRGRGAARGHRRAGRARGRQLGRDDQARGERVPHDARLLRQRDRERLRARRRGRAARRRRRRPRPPPRAALPARRDRLGRLVLPEGLARAQAARGELRLPLPAAVAR